MEQQGFLHVIYGCMFSGKTTRLYQLLKKYSQQGYKTILYSHLNEKSRTNRITDDENFKKIFVEELNSSTIVNNDIKVIGIDEIQFFNDHIQDFIETNLLNNKIIIACGLDGTFERKPFGCIHKILQYAYQIEKLYADCEDCKTDPPNGEKLPAIYTFRTSSMQDLVVIEDCHYKPVCKYHYEVGNIIKK